MSVVVGVSMVKDEADIIEVTLRHMLTQVDCVIVADNMSSDATPAILHSLSVSFPDRFLAVRDDNPAYYQSAKMTELAFAARREFDAEWIVPFDADEIWYSSFAPTLKERLEILGPQWQVVQADLYDHVATAFDNPNLLDPTQRMTWRSAEKLDLPKVACRWRKDLRIDYGNHRAFYDDSGCTVSHDRFVVRHFPYRSPEQFLTKIRNGYAAYQAGGEDLDDYGGHWKGYGRLLEREGPDVVLADVYYRWFYDQNPVQSREQGRRPLIEDPAPVRRG